MNIRTFGSGYNIGLKEATPKAGQESRRFYFDPAVLADLIKGQKFNQGSVEIHPIFGLSLFIGHRKVDTARKVERSEPVWPGENKHEP